MLLLCFACCCLSMGSVAVRRRYIEREEGETKSKKPRLLSLPLRFSHISECCSYLGDG